MHHRFRNLSPASILNIVAAMLGFLLVFGGVSGCSGIRPPKGVKPQEMVVTTTAYCPCGKCCGWERTWWGRPVYAYGPMKGQRKKIGITASGSRAKRGTVAADTSVFPFGTVVYVDGYGFGRVEDRGGAIKGKHIDLFFSSHQRALEWGRKTQRIKVWFP